uniref:Oligosaccharyltransferase complex subunit n=1 Tax=Phascolarctos cinereus TaxID=38626 RepID=A0A6P5LJU4_PHACI|nr:oligosaccharyltransferase complex subunit ostc-B-like [Phascolarctos cinereus]
MEKLYYMLFVVLKCPSLKLKKPSGAYIPLAMVVHSLVMVSYCLITGQIICDNIMEPPNVGSMTDGHGHQKLVAFLSYRVNGQYIMEGLATSFLFTIRGLDFIVLDLSEATNTPRINRFILLCIDCVNVLLIFFMEKMFLKLLGYLLG